MSKIQFEIEYLVHSSALILYNCISNPSSLEEWFADSVNQKGDRFTFKWEDEERQAKLLSSKKTNSFAGNGMKKISMTPSLRCASKLTR